MDAVILECCYYQPNGQHEVNINININILAKDNNNAKIKVNVTNSATDTVADTTVGGPH